MSVSLTIPIYQRRQGRYLSWTTVGLGPWTVARSGRSPVKLQQAIAADLKAVLRELEPRLLPRFELSRGLRLERVRLELTLRGGGGKRKLTGHYPLIVEPRWFADDRRQLVAYHPGRQRALEWFPVDEARSLAEQATLYFARVWAELADEDLAELTTDRKDRLKSFSLTAATKGLLDRLERRQRGVWDDLVAEPRRSARGPKRKRRRGFKVLDRLGVDQTLRAADGTLPLGMPRQPQRAELARLLGEGHGSAVVIGPPGVGKTTLIQRWIADRLEADDFAAHRNLDRVCHVWSIAGKQLIAGMIYLGDWEKRCIELLEDVTETDQRALLWVEDLQAFGRLGRSRDSDRNLADLFRGPVGRGELRIVAECTQERWQRLEDDAPSFAALFGQLQLRATSPAKTLKMMLHRARQLEQRYRVTFDPFLHRAVLELGGSLLSAGSFPGTALELIEELARRADRARQLHAGAEGRADGLLATHLPASQGSRGNEGQDDRLTPQSLIELLSEKTGLPRLLLSADAPLDPAVLATELGAQVIGQSDGVEAAVDLIMRIRAGLTAPGRPYAVYLITGPTGTGKTELSKCVAEYLYGDPGRLLRFDMSELSGADAVARLIGDRYGGSGLLTEAVRQQPFAVVLLDEIEKAHRSVFNLLLQLFDEGRLTDAAGEVADFTHAVVLMTSNLGARSQASAGLLGARETDEQARIAHAVEAFFPPELFNRIDRVVPFRPLDAGAARRIADKELGRLLGRWGLTERNIFVDCGEAPLAKIVAEGFDPRYGARTVKRYLEERVGTLLAEQIATAGPAAMRALSIYLRDGELAVHGESLAEAAALEAPYAIEPLLALGPRELKALLPTTMDRLDALLQSDALEQVSADLSTQLARHQAAAEAAQAADDADARQRQHAAEMVYRLETVRTELTKLRRRVGYHLARPVPDRHQVLECLAEVEFLERALDKAYQPEQHGALVKLVNVGVARRRAGRAEARGGLLAEIATACAASRATVEQIAARLPGKAEPLIREPEGDDGTAALERVLARNPRPDLLVLRLGGLGVYDYLEGERGCQIWRSLRAGSEVVRVDVQPAGLEADAGEALRAHLAASRRFVAALEAGAGDRPPENPEGLAPAIREYRFDPPDDARASAISSRAPLEVEDYLLGYAETLSARSIAEVLPHLWMLRMSRVPSG